MVIKNIFKIFLFLSLVFSVSPFGVSAQNTSDVPIRTGSAVPSTCTPSNPSTALFLIKTGASEGLYKCTATNTWTKIGSGTPGSIEQDLFNIKSAPFNAVCDGVTDDTAAIQAAIQAAFNNGGGVVYVPFSNAPCKVTKLTIPPKGELAGGYPVITFRGSNQPNTMFGIGLTFGLSNKGSIIQSNATGGAILTATQSVEGYINLSYVKVVMENIEIRSYDNPNIDGIDATNASQFWFENLRISTGVYSYLASLPTNNTYAIKFPKDQNGGWIGGTGLDVAGYKFGLKLAEHAVLDNIWIHATLWPVNFYATSHGITIGRICIQNCPHAFRWEGAARVNIAQYDAEHKVNIPGHWQTFVDDISDETSIGRGTMHYNIVNGSAGYVPNGLVKNGGYYFDARDSSGIPYEGRGIKTSPPTIPNNAYTALTFTDSEDTEYGLTHSDMATGTFTVLHTGSYNISAFTHFAPNATGARSLVVEAGGIIYDDTKPAMTGGLGTTCIVTKNVFLVKNQTVKARVFQTSGGDLVAGEGGYANPQLQIRYVGVNP